MRFKLCASIAYGQNLPCKGLSSRSYCRKLKTYRSVLARVEAESTKSQKFFESLSRFGPLGPAARSELLNGKIANKSVDKLLYYAPGGWGLKPKLDSLRPTKRLFGGNWPPAARWQFYSAVFALDARGSLSLRGFYPAIRVE